ncbi:MAG: tetratricopeptide repeat protein [Nitrospira sp.]|nr:tetratricopeptide repeat protein [Nitrospira sp.]
MSEDLGELYRKVGLLLRDDKWDEAIAVYTEIIRLEEAPERKSMAYSNRGVAYVGKGDYDLAIQDYNEAIELRLEASIAYSNRSIAHLYKENYPSALEDSIKANNYDEGRKSNDLFGYITCQLRAITSNRADHPILFGNYFKLANTIVKIRGNLFYDDELPQGIDVAHYTSLHVLEALANNNPFRLYNSAYMDDPTEGRVFFEIMKDEFDVNVKEIFYKTDSEDSHSSPAYIGSFVKTDSQNGGRKDKLLLWRAYGKHDNEAAGGACLIFQKDQFAQQVPLMEIGAMAQWQKDATKQGGATFIRDLRPVLYRVIYNYKESDKSESENRPNLAALLKELASRLNDMAKLLEAPGIHKENFIQLVRELLDSIRFLFKADSYSEEQEVRVVQMAYDTDGHPPPGRKVAIDRMPPRFYLEVPGNFRFNEVILGPKAGNVSEWKQWMSEKNGIKVEKSKIPFR